MAAQIPTSVAVSRSPVSASADAPSTSWCGILRDGPRAAPAGWPRCAGQHSPPCAQRSSSAVNSSATRGSRRAAARVPARCDSVPDFTTPMMRIVRAPESVTRRPTASVTKARRANVSLTMATVAAETRGVECPPPTHRHPHRFEIAGGDDVEAQFGVFAGLRLIALCAESPASGAGERRVRTRLAASTPGSARTRSTADW